MSSDTVANPPTTAGGESKSARKRKARAEAAAAATIPLPERTTSELNTNASEQAGKTNGVEGSSENAYIKELQKQIRNVNKKLNAMQKVDAIIDANPGVSLDDLVASRKINNDQRASALKKPHLQAQLQQLEEQLAQYKKFDQEYQDKIAHEKELLQRSHSEELEKLRETLKAEAALEKEKAFREDFLTLSRFLRAAAARRQLEDEESDLTKAFEGALLLVYGGDANAVAAVEKLIKGSDDSVPSTENVMLSITYAQLKQAALDEAPFHAEEAWVDDVAQAQAAAPETDEPATAASTDPTVVNAGLTEINDKAVPLDLGVSTEAPSAPAAASVDTGAADAAAEQQWDKQPSATDDPMTESFEMVPRNPSETETPAAAAPVGSVQSWADDTAEAVQQAASAVASAPAPTNGNDGFSEVQHNRGRGRGGFQGRGSFRGRGPREGGRGRGGRGRGRGDYRGGNRGGFRGGRGGAGESAE